jgi:hypothetical protein
MNSVRLRRNFFFILDCLERFVPNPKHSCKYVFMMWGQFIFQQKKKEKRKKKEKKKNGFASMTNMFG